MALSKIRSDSMTDNAIQSNRNFIINGAMKVAQRGTSAVAAGAGTYPSIDRFKAWEGTDGAFTVEQSTTTPAGFTTSFKAQVTTADTSLAAAQYAQLSHQIEAQNLQNLEYGTSGAKTLTLSFYVRSSKTGSYSITLYKDDATKYLFSKSYTIDSANTWEKKIITITPTAGSTSFITSAAGAIANDNGIGFYVFWNLAGGTTYDDATDNAWSSNTNHFHTSSQVNWMDNTSNNFYLTGVQLEVGDVATAFEHEDIGTTLAKCQRYFEILEWQGVVGNGNSYSTAQFQGCNQHWKVNKRANPTITFPTIGTSSNTVGITIDSGGYATQGSVLRAFATVTQMNIYNNSGDGYSGFTDDSIVSVYSNGTTQCKIDAEL